MYQKWYVYLHFLGISTFSVGKTYWYCNVSSYYYYSSGTRRIKSIFGHNNRFVEASVNKYHFALKTLLSIHFINRKCLEPKIFSTMSRDISPCYIHTKDSGVPFLSYCPLKRGCFWWNCVPFLFAHNIITRHHKYPGPTLMRPFISDLQNEFKVKDQTRVLMFNPSLLLLLLISSMSGLPIDRVQCENNLGSFFYFKSYLHLKYQIKFN